MEHLKTNKLKRTKYCGNFSQDDIGQTVVAMGWVAKQRDLGNLIFIDLRDRTGIIQLAFDDKTSPKIFWGGFLWFYIQKSIVLYYVHKLRGKN